MAAEREKPSRREALKVLGAVGAAATLGDTVYGQSAPVTPMAAAAGFAAELRQRVEQTVLVDTHEHLPDEDERLRGEGLKCDDWAGLLGHYLDSDLVAAGMPQTVRAKVFSPGGDPLAKWRAIAPYWPAVKNTGYGRSVRIAIRELYGIDDLEEKSIGRLQQGYESLRKAGFYRKILVDMAGIESCQVNHVSSGGPFKESRQPTLLMQDLNITHMHMWGPDLKGVGGPTGKEVRDLSDWHAVIRWWFDKYGPYAVAVKCQGAYSRKLDFDQVPPEKAAPVFRKVVGKEPVSSQDMKLLEDHLFWYAVEQATLHGLPVKVHTGYLTGENFMPLGHVAGNPVEAAEMCRKSPHTQFVFMHIAYPYWQPMIAVAKHYSNAHIDLCWAWILDPLAAKQFLKNSLVAAPANKILTFGGDYLPVECVLGHARIARHGIVQALEELVDEGWLERRDALELVEPLLRGNAYRIFQLEAKSARLRKAPWISRGKP